MIAAAREGESTRCSCEVALCSCTLWPLYIADSEPQTIPLPRCFTDVSPPHLFLGTPCVLHFNKVSHVLVVMSGRLMNPPRRLSTSTTTARGKRHHPQHLGTFHSSRTRRIVARDHMITRPRGPRGPALPLTH